MLRKTAAFAVHTDLIVTRVAGADARSWLNDLVTADVATLESGMARPSLLLTPTGRIRASFAIAAQDASFLLLQSDDQSSVASLLGPYVLSSDVRMDPDERVFVSAPEAPDGTEMWTPSLLPLAAPSGALLAVDPQDLPALIGAFTSEGLAQANPSDVETLRVIEGVPRFPVDLDQTSLPAEAGWEDRIDLTKGCFLGQESVAKVRNLGHPPRLVMALSTEAAASPGDEVFSEGDGVGEITSAVRLDGVTRAIARVRWNSARAELTLASGSLLRRA